MQDGPAFNSWKEIAAYLGKGVRTVQRWEEELALPVHRLPGKRRDIVLAYPAEIEDWLQKNSARLKGLDPSVPKPLELVTSEIVERAR